MLDPHAAAKARILEEWAAEQPRDPAAELDLERERELMHLHGRGRGYLTAEERDELAAIRARQNERARERNRATRQAAQKLEAERREAEQRAAVEAEQAQVRPRLRAAFVGTDAEFAEKWPQLWARYRDRQALEAAVAAEDATLAEKRRQLGL